VLKCELFAEMVHAWRDLKRGILPASGGRSRQNPALLAACYRLEYTEAQVERELAEARASQARIDAMNAY
jgi:hypothetical protein